MFAEKLSAQEVIDKTVRFKPDMVGMTVLTPSAPNCSILSRMIRIRLPEAKIVWGAIHADIFGQDIVRAGDADFCIHHDGEETIVELVDALADNEKDFSGVDGITWMSTMGRSLPTKPGLSTETWTICLTRLGICFLTSAMDSCRSLILPSRC